MMAEQEVCAASKVVLELDEVLENLARLRTSVDVVAEKDEGSRLILRSFYDPDQGIQNAMYISNETDLEGHSVTRGSSS